MRFKIEWRGNEYTNSSSRKGQVPFIIVEHITDTDTFTSPDSWFRSKNNHGSSAHFIIGLDGRIGQYVDIERMAWSNGLTSGYKGITSDLIKEIYNTKSIKNPNYYSVSIEHVSKDGTLTDIQLEASIWLHKHISTEIKRVYNQDIIFDRKHLIGHNEIDKINKPYCPSYYKNSKFPWDRLINMLNDKPNIRFLGKEINCKSLKNIDGVTSVELRDLFESIGLEVNWDSEKEIVTIGLK